MGRVVKFTVPGVPIGKGRPRVASRGGHARMYTPEKTAAYEGLVAHAGRVAMAGAAPIEGGCSVVLDVCLPVPESWSKKKQAAALAGQVLATKKPDTDNVIKAIFDGLNAVAWRDDVQVVRVTTQKRYGATPGVAVQITELEGVEA